MICLHISLGPTVLSDIRVYAGSMVGSVVIQWQPADTTSNNDIRYFHIRYWKTGISDALFNQQVPNTDGIMIHTVTGLETRSNYNFQVCRDFF